MCHRYAGTRPSDFFTELDEVDALILDVSMAYKFNTRDFDLTNERLHNIIDTVSMGFTAMGGKKPKHGKPPIKLARKDNYEEEDDVPFIRDIIAASAGANKRAAIVIE